MKKLLLLSLIILSINAFGQFTKPILYQGINSEIRNKGASQIRLASMMDSLVKSLQVNLVSGTNIKTINGVSLLGSGNIVISSGGGIWGTITGTLSDQTDLINALNLKSPLSSPIFTGVPSAPTASPGTSTTQLATTAFVANAVTAGSVADGDKGDITVSGTGSIWTIDNSAVNSAKIASNIALSGSPTTTTQTANTNNTTISTTAYVDAKVVDAINDGVTTTASSQNALFDALATKQTTLVSGSNIKTVNSNSLLGSGNVAVGDALVANPLSQFSSTTSAQLRGVISDESGTGNAYFQGGDAGTPSALVGTNITGTAPGLTAGTVTTNANLTGAVTSTGNATSLGSFTSANLSGALTDETGTGVAVFATSPAFVGTPTVPTAALTVNSTQIPSIAFTRSLIGFVTPEMYGAVGDGVTNDQAALQSCVNSGSECRLQNKNYFSSTSIVLPDNAVLSGMGALSIISTTANISLISIQGINTTVQDLTLKGNDTGAAQDLYSMVGNGAFTLYRYGAILENVLLLDAGRAGVYVTNVVGSSSGTKHEGGFRGNSVRASSCAIGFLFDTRGEYSSMTNCHADNCVSYGVRMNSGNNNWTGGAINDNLVGVYLGSGTNDGHSVMSGTKINHNGTNVQSVSTANGYMFDGCMLYAGNVSLNGATGIKFHSCEFSTFSISSTTSTSEFKDCYFVTTPTSISFTGTPPAFWNTTVLTGVYTNMYGMLGSTSTAQVHIKGAGTTNTTSSFYVSDNSGNRAIEIRDDLAIRLFANGTPFNVLSVDGSNTLSKTGGSIQFNSVNEKGVFNAKGVTFRASTSAANTAPLYITSGTLMTTPEAGAMEFDGTNMYFTPGSVRYLKFVGLVGSSSLDFGSIGPQSQSSLTITVTGAADGDEVVLGVPNASFTAGLIFTARVSSANTVSIQCYNGTVGAIDPASGTFKASVIKR